MCSSLWQRAPTIRTEVWNTTVAHVNSNAVDWVMQYAMDEYQGVQVSSVTLGTLNLRTTCTSGSCKS